MAPLAMVVGLACRQQLVNTPNGPPRVMRLEAVDDPGGSGVEVTHYAFSAACEPGSMGTCSTYIEPVAVGTDGVFSLHFFSVDTAGNAEPQQSIQVKVDRTPPEISYTGNQEIYTLVDEVDITCSASDGLSGVAAHTYASMAGPAFAFMPGLNESTATAEDLADNIGSGSCAFTIDAGFGSPCDLTTQFSTKAGVAKALCSKLRSAAAAEERGQYTAMANKLNAYVNHVAAQTGKAFTEEQASILVRFAEELTP